MKINDKNFDQSDLFYNKKYQVKVKVKTVKDNWIQLETDDPLRVIYYTVEGFCEDNLPITE